MHEETLDAADEMTDYGASAAPSWIMASLAPAACLVCGTVLLVVQRYVAPAGDRSYSPLHGIWSLSAIVACYALACAILVFRYRKPAMVFVVEAVLVLPACLVGLDSWGLVLMLVAYYALSVGAGRWAGVIWGGLVSIAVALGVMLFDGVAETWVDACARVAPVACVGLLSAAVRSSRLARAARHRECMERQYAVMADKQRRKALRRCDIAGELHDSVGHGLTTIIVLAQGLEVSLQGRVDENDESFEVIDAIRNVAQDSLASARTALHRLRNDEEDEEDAQGDVRNDAAEFSDMGDRSGGLKDGGMDGRLRSWDDIHRILDDARQVGVIVTMNRTGQYMPDDGQTDLCYMVIREAVTNAMRHTAGAVRHIDVNVDCRQAGAMKLLVDNDGVPDVPDVCEDPMPSGRHSGTGLERIRKTIERGGGSMAWSKDEQRGYWHVCALIPTQRMSQTHDLDGHMAMHGGLRSGNRHSADDGAAGRFTDSVGNAGVAQSVCPPKPLYDVDGGDGDDSGHDRR